MGKETTSKPLSFQAEDIARQESEMQQRTSSVELPPSVPGPAAGATTSKVDLPNAVKAPSSLNMESKPATEASTASLADITTSAEPVDVPPADSPHLSCFTWPFWLQLLRFVGPGFMVAMAYIDPGNLAADINQGVAAGYTLAWVTLWCSIMGFVIQMLAAKLGVATGRHLAQHCRTQYPPFPRITLWAATELGIIAVDMIEVIGGATALGTLSGGAIPLWAGVFITAACGFMILWLERWGMRLLEAVLITVIALMGGTFGYMFFSSGVNYGQVALGLVVPKLNSGTIPYAVGAVGAIIMPHNLYLHSDLVLERPHALRGNSVREAMRFVRIEAAVALTLALIINIFIISVFGRAFGPGVAVSTAMADAGCTHVGLGNAGVCLGVVFGTHMQYIWGAGLLAAAFASTVTSTYAGQIVLTGMMGIKASKWWRTALMRLVTLGPTLSVAVLLKSESALNTLTEWLNIIQSLVLPFVVVPLLVFTSSTKIMGPHANRPWSIGALSLILTFLVAMNGYLAVTFALGKLPDVAWARALFGIGCVLYFAFGFYLLIGPIRVNKWVVNGAKKASEKAKPVINRAVDMMEVHV